MESQERDSASIFDINLLTGIVVLFLVLTFATIILAAPAAQAQTFNVLYTFTGGSNDGGYPDGGLTINGDGTFYGSTFGGPPSQSFYGNVFRFQRHGSDWVFSILYSFEGGNDGEYPSSPLAVGPDGVLYGATTGGGDVCRGQGIGCGTVYAVRPPAGPCKVALCRWTETVIYNFGDENTGTDPAHMKPVFDSQGNLYGTAEYSDASGGYGVVFKLTPQQGGWTESTLYSFAGGTDGQYPESGVIFDTAGNLYGAVSTSHFGEIYELTPSGSGWVKNTLYNFGGGGDGSTPIGGLIFDSQGNLYGSTSLDGTGGGTVFQLAPLRNGTWAENLLADLPGTGMGPSSSLTMDAARNLYGTTYQGGAYGYGSVFELTFSNGTWTYGTLHDFSGGSDGAYPIAGVTLDANGNLYGTAGNGGSGQGYEGYGVIWEITP
jgi:uncharacterized repeat protein (TIGR03803 family)